MKGRRGERGGRRFRILIVDIFDYGKRGREDSVGHGLRRGGRGGGTCWTFYFFPPLRFAKAWVGRHPRDSGQLRRQKGEY